MMIDGGLTILEDQPLEGLSEALETEKSASSERQIELAAKALARVPGSHGVRGLPDFWKSVIETIQSRRVREIQGPFDVPAHWFSFHVPADAKGQLQLSTKSGSKTGLKIKAAGTGWGSGRNITMTVDRDFGERVRCFRAALLLKTRVTLYEGDHPPRADVLSVSGLAISELNTCPDCSGENEHAGAMLETDGSWDNPIVDHSQDTVGETLERTLEIVEEQDVSLSLPFQIPGAKAEFGINWSRQTSMTCRVKYVFPGGHRFRACATTNEPNYLPYWRME
jgi:hypothetical protein